MLSNKKFYFYKFKLLENKDIKITTIKDHLNVY